MIMITCDYKENDKKIEAMKEESNIETIKKEIKNIIIEKGLFCFYSLLKDILYNLSPDDKKFKDPAETAEYLTIKYWRENL